MYNTNDAINILQKATDTNQIVGFSHRGIDHDCTVLRVSWDDMQDVCTVKTLIDSQYITVPVNKMEKVRLK